MLMMKRFPRFVLVACVLETETSVREGGMKSIIFFFEFFVAESEHFPLLEADGCDLPMFSASDLLKKIKRTSWVLLASLRP